MCECDSNYNKHEEKEEELKNVCTFELARFSETFEFISFSQQFSLAFFVFLKFFTPRTSHLTRPRVKRYFYTRYIFRCFKSSIVFVWLAWFAVFSTYFYSIRHVISVGFDEGNKNINGTTRLAPCILFIRNFSLR